MQFILFPGLYFVTCSCKEETDSTRNKSLVDKLNLIQANLDDIEGLIKEIQDSKINKFW